MSVDTLEGECRIREVFEIWEQIEVWGEEGVGVQEVICEMEELRKIYGIQGIHALEFHSSSDTK